MVDPLLLRAVPASIRKDAHVAMRALVRAKHATTAELIQDTYAHTADYPEICVEGELIQIPYRLHYEWPGADFLSDLSATQRLVLACWMSRHADGRRRQEALGHLLEADETWTVPFVVQLCGEYVVEIGQDALDFITHILPFHSALKEQYIRFAQDNPEFMLLTKQRALSYWNDDYRGKLRREEYPQLAALEAIALLKA